MKQIVQKCRNGYKHFWVPSDVTVNERGATLAGINEGLREIEWDREIVLICARCGNRTYLDSVVRTYYEIEEDDWKA